MSQEDFYSLKLDKPEELIFLQTSEQLKSKGEISHGDCDLHSRRRK